MSTRNTRKQRTHTYLAMLGLAAGCSPIEGGHEQPASPVEVGLQTAALTLAEIEDQCAEDPRVTNTLIDQDVCVGGELFFRDDFGGNGRTCGSCHPAGNNFTIDPPFIGTLPASDPLFVAENIPALAQLEMPTLMRDFGLILENPDDFADPTVKFVMRSVPHCFSLSTSDDPAAGDGTTTPPFDRTGWSGDGAPGDGEFRDFQTGAIIQHYTQSLNRIENSDFVLANDDELDAINAFMTTIGRSNELDLSTIVLSDSAADAGRTTFMSGAARCNACHNNAGANAGFAGGGNRNFNTGVENGRLAAVDAVATFDDGGFGGQGLATPNFDTDGDTVNDAFGNGTFNTPPLIEAADTGPFFHTNAAQTIEDAVAFYNTPEFNNSPAGTPNIALSTVETLNIARFLRVLNAEFNIQLAIYRAEGALPIIIADKNASRDLQQGLLGLALAEVDDALEVLAGQSNLNVAAQADLADAQGFLQTASTHASHTQRRNAAEDALAALAAARGELSTTPEELEFVMGQGTLMF